MPFTLTMPKLSPTMEEGTITKWRKKTGDLVKAGDILFEVATDKATVEHSALDDGYLRKILIDEGKEAVVNQAVAVFTETKDESIEGYVPEGIKPKEKVIAMQPLPQETAAPVSRLQETKSGQAIQQPSFVPEPPLEGYEFPSPAGEVSDRAFASPLAKKQAEEQGIDITTVKGSGPQGRIMSRDLPMGQAKAIASFGHRARPTLPPGSYEEESLTPMRKVIGQRLQQSKTFIPHFYVMQEVDARAMITVRDQLKNMGVKITFNDLVIKATSLALREHPEMNSGFNSQNSSIIRFKTIDVSVAVSVSAGLITPIIRHADYKNLGQLSSEMRLLAQKAKEGKLSREEYVGGSFTISNLGMFGVTGFVGVINPPQAGILSIGAVQEKPICVKGEVVAGSTMQLTLSADHRVVDGTDGARFMKTLQNLLENPSILLL